MECVDCNRKLPRVLEKCVYCGGALKASDTADEPINCAECETVMEKNTLLGVTIDECPDCQARWFDVGELETLMDEKAAAGIETPFGNDIEPGEIARFRLDQTKVEYRDCPRCDQAMLRQNYEQISGIMVDTCSRHGMFLDANEFARLRAFVETKGPELAKQMREQERERHLKQMKKIQKIEEGRRELRSSKKRAPFGYYQNEELLDALATVGKLFKSFFPHRHKE